MTAGIKNRIIGIAGGSGSGKSTLAVALAKKYPDRCALLHVDDYFKAKELVPKVGNISNWDHPGAIRFDDLYNDLVSLKNGKAVRILTKSELYNPAYDHSLRNKIEHTVPALPIIILEGYLAFVDQRIRDLMDLKVYLDIPAAESIKRRSSNKFMPDQAYIDKVLLPMFREFVEPTKAYADLIIDVSGQTPDEVLNIAEKRIILNY